MQREYEVKREECLCALLAFRCSHSARLYLIQSLRIHAAGPLSLLPPLGLLHASAHY